MKFKKSNSRIEDRKYKNFFFAKTSKENKSSQISFKRENFAAVVSLACTLEYAFKNLTNGTVQSNYILTRFEIFPTALEIIFLLQSRALLCINLQKLFEICKNALRAKFCNFVRAEIHIILTDLYIK